MSREVRRHFRLPSWRVLLISLIGLGGAVFFGVVSWIFNGQPSTQPFNGWVLVLEPAGADLSSDRVALILTPAVPGAPGGHPELGYTVVVCGSRPFHGALLIGGDAQLSGLHVPGPLASDATQAVVSSTPELVIGDEGTGNVLDLGAAQVVTLNLATIEPCVASSPSDEVFGSAILLAGNAGAAIQRHWTFAWWSAPRQSEAWPLLGRFPGSSASDLGMFTGIRGISGSWIRPVQSRFEVHVGSLTAKTSVDVAVPASTDPTGLGWAMTAPFQATARLTDSDATSRWQQLLVAASIALGLGGGLLTNQLFEWGRTRSRAHPAQEASDPPRCEQPDKPSIAEAPSASDPSRSTSLSQILAGAAIGAVFAWIMRAPRRKSRARRR